LILPVFAGFTSLYYRSDVDNILLIFNTYKKVLISCPYRSSLKIRYIKEIIMKKTDLAKKLGNKINNRVSNSGAASPFKSTEPVIDKKEQRKRDQALGLIPFAVKIDEKLVAQINTMALERKIGINELVTELLKKGMA
jgi:hypothetical protein